MASSSSSGGSTGKGSQGSAVEPESMYIFCGQPVVKTMKLHVLAAGTVMFGLVSVSKRDIDGHLFFKYSFLDVI